MNKGLKEFGIDAIAKMNDLGIIIDVSHLSDGGFYDVAKYTKITNSNLDILFSTILGDITDQIGGLQIAYDSINNNKGDATMRILAGNHDTYFDQWSEYYELFGSSTYFFVVKTPTTSDLFIALETASGTLGKLQKKWLEDTLKEKRSQHRYCFILTHTNFFDTDLSQFPSGNFPLEETAFLTNIFAARFKNN